MVAAEHGQLGLVHYLIDRGAAIEARDEVRGINVICSVLKYLKNLSTLIVQNFFYE